MLSLSLFCPNTALVSALNDDNLLFLGHFGAEPVETFVKSITGGCATCLDVPRATLKSVQAQFVSDLGCSLCLGKILLVGKDKQNCFSELILAEHFLQLLSSILKTTFIVGVPC